MRKEFFQIPKFKNYTASRDGRIRPFPRLMKGKNGHMVPHKWVRDMAFKKREFGYCVSFMGISYRVDELVAATFIGRKPKSKFVWHKNGNLFDNRSKNLAYKTLYEIHNLNVKNCTEIIGYPNYILSKTGIVVNKTTGRRLSTPYGIANKCLVVRLWKGNKSRMFNLYRLLGIHFRPNPENKKEVHHKDYDRMNISLNNLYWATPSENMKDAYDTGHCKEFYEKGFSHKLCKLTPEKLDLLFQRRKDGKKLVEIGKEFGLNWSYVSKILNGAVYGRVFSK